MRTKYCSLPDWNFVGGETQTRSFTLQQSHGENYNLPDTIAQLTVVDFVNRRSGSVLTKQFDVEADANGDYCEVNMELAPTETVDMSGKYIYQLSVRDSKGNISIPKQGIMIVTENIDKSFIS